MGCIPSVRPLAQCLSTFFLERNKQRSEGPFLPLANLSRKNRTVSKEPFERTSYLIGINIANNTAHHIGSLDDVERLVENRV